MAPEPRAVLILADGVAPARLLLDRAWPGWDAGVDLVIAADGGARHAAALGLRVDRWVGDGDSIPADELAALREAGVAVHEVAAAKDESDTELALLDALEARAGAIILVGALGGPRVDHALANLGLLDHPALGPRSLTIYDERAARISVLAATPDGPARRELRGRPGDLVSLLPLGGDAAGVTTAGLRYPLADEPLRLGRTRGLSNVREGREASVALRSGRLLLIETPANLDR